MSECRLTMPTGREFRGRGLWCIEHRDWAQDFAECRTATLTHRADRLQGVIDAILDAHTGCTADTCTTVASAEAAL